MSLLHVSLFGCIRVAHDDTQNEIKMTHSTQALLAYLILFRHRTHTREALAEVFWGEKNQGHSRSSLNTALWRLRNAMESSGFTPGTYLASNHGDEIGFIQDSPFWLDVQVFVKETNQVVLSQTADIGEEYLKNLEYALALYSGDLMEGFYDDWALREREHYRARYLSTLVCLMNIYHHRSDFNKSLSCGQRILELDPLREEIHRYMMKLYIEIGQRSLAARQYEICREVLSRELQIAPMQETVELYERLSSPNQHVNSPLRMDPVDELQLALSQLRQAQITFEQARGQLETSLRVFESVIHKQ